MENSAIRKAASGGLALVLAGSLSVPAYSVVTGQSFSPEAHAAAGFPDADVVPGAWYAPYVEWASQNGVVKGYDDGLFRPDQSITRGQVAVMLCRAAGADVSDASQWPENATGWTDVADNAYYTHAMNWAWENGVFQGSGDKVRPEDTITREEIATVAARFAERQLNLDVSSTGIFWPSTVVGVEQVSSWANDAWKWLAAEGVMGGFDNGDGTTSLVPQGETTRAQFAKIVTSLLRDVAPGTEERPEFELAKVEAYDVTATSASFRALDADGTDRTQLCEFSLDGGKTWSEQASAQNLEEETSYTVMVRLRGDVDATPVSVTFKTLAASGTEQPGDDQKPGDDQNPGDDQMPGDDQKPGEDEQPGDETTPGGDETPDGDQQPGGEDNPGGEQPGGDESGNTDNPGSGNEGDEGTDNPSEQPDEGGDVQPDPDEDVPTPPVTEPEEPSDPDTGGCSRCVRSRPAGDRPR